MGTSNSGVRACASRRHELLHLLIGIRTAEGGGCGPGDFHDVPASLSTWMAEGMAEGIDDCSASIVCRYGEVPHAY